MRPQCVRVTCRLFALVLFLTATGLNAAEPAYQLRVVTDRKDAIYEAGGEAKFLITVSKGDEVVPNSAVKFVVNDFLKSVDATCPPSSCYAAFNALRGPKEMINEPLMSHAAPPHIQEAFLARVLDHVKRHSAKP